MEFGFQPCAGSAGTVLVLNPSSGPPTNNVSVAQEATPSTGFGIVIARIPCRKIADHCTCSLVMNHLVYGLIDPRTRLIRYVGKSSRGMTRPTMHHKKPVSDQTYCARWVRSLQRAGYAVEICVLEYLQTETQALAAEVWWIAYGQLSAWPLTNLTDGGEGMCNPHPQTRKKMSESAKRRGTYVRSQETKNKMRKARLGWRPTPETRARMSESGKKRLPPSDETREKLRTASTGRKYSIEILVWFGIVNEV